LLVRVVTPGLVPAMVPCPRRQELSNANSVVEMWPDQKCHGAFGQLSVHCAQDVTKAWSAAFFETK